MAPRETDDGQERTVIVLLCGDAEVTRWALGDAGPADLGLIDELARLQLTARRVGYSIRLLHVDRHLADLLILTGLADILAADPPQPPGPACPACEA